MWGYAMGLDQFPGLITIMATVSAIIGIYYIERGSRERLAETEEAAQLKVEGEDDD
jgi:hypothetical protein